MAMEHTGLGAFEITANLRVTATNTVAVWKARAEDGGYFVNFNVAAANIPTGDDDLITVDLLADGDHDHIVGLLRSADYDSNGNLVGRILLAASDVRVTGGGTGALATGDMLDGIQGDADGKAEITGTPADSFGRIIGGTQANLRMSFMSILLRDNTTA